MLTFGSVVLHMGKQINKNSDQDTGFVTQLIDDWEQKPYTDIAVQSSDCSSGYERLYEAHYQGAGGGCDCTGVWGYYMNGDNRLHVGQSCTYNQTRYGCIQFSGMKARDMFVLPENKVVCGKAVGTPFRNAVRPNV
jgi:hypothetical protein